MREIGFSVGRILKFLYGWAIGGSQADRHPYFAYGSNLLDREVHRHASSAEGVAVAFLKDYRLIFSKHSTTRRGDAASIEPSAGDFVWGYLYRVTDEDHDALRQREKGYSEAEVRVWRVSERHPSGREVRAFAFIGNATCSRSCGPSDEYLELILEGAHARKLPEEYISRISAARKSRET
jgi:cation transport regulator ChaC